MAHTITEVVSITTETETTVAGSETKTAVIRTVREPRTTVGSETRVAVVSETKVLAIKILRELRIIVVSEIKTTEAPTIAASEILKAPADRSLHQVGDSETAQAAKAAVALQDNRAVAALDKTIINNKTNS